MSWLPGATRHAPAHITGDTLTLSIAAGTVRITIQEAGARRVGQMSLPLLQVSMRFSGVDPEARDRFIEYFDLYTRRGGG
jgi:hypothetical protein